MGPLKKASREAPTATPRQASLGFRVHSGWAAYSVVSGTPRAPAVIDRGRVEMADRKDSGSIQPYHTAEGVSLEKAESLLKRYSDTARRMAESALDAVIDNARERGYVLSGCGLLLGSGRSGVSLQSILSSHALIHTADGNHFRSALTEACERHGLAVTGVPEKELLDRGSALLGLPPGEVKRWLADLGRPLGPPWTQEEKHAALVACLVLAGARSSPKR